MTGQNHHVLTNKKVVFIFPSFGFSGAEKQAFLLANHLKSEYGSHVSFWAFSDPGQLADLCDGAGIQWRSVANPQKGIGYMRPIRLLRFREEIALEKPDLLMPYMIAPCVTVGSIAALTGAKCVWNQRDEGDRGRMNKLQEIIAVKSCAMFISNSIIGANFMVNSLHAPQCKVHVVRNGISLEPQHWSREEWRRKLQIDPKDFVVLMAANLTQNKDHKALINAWQEYLRLSMPRNAKSTLVLAGYHGNAASNILSQISHLGLGDTIRLPGTITDISGLYAAADIYVHSSQKEGLSNSILEAMLAGLPVIATDIPGTREIFEMGGKGKMVSAGNPTQIAESLVWYLANPLEATLHGAENYSFIRKYFSTEKYLEESVKILVLTLGAEQR